MTSILGIDYSMTSPSLCFFTGGDFNFSNCKIHYLTSRKKCQGHHDNMSGDLFPLVEGMAKFNMISDWVMDLVKKYEPQKVYLEDYAYGASGRIFHIAENTGLLKYKLWLAGIEAIPVAPTTIKKFAASKGNVKKDGMEVAFIEETKYNVKEVLEMTPKQWNPSSDIIDSYYICKYGYNQEKAT